MLNNRRKRSIEKQAALNPVEDHNTGRKQAFCYSPVCLAGFVFTNTWRNPTGRSSCVPFRGTFLHSMDLGHGTIT